MVLRSEADLDAVARLQDELDHAKSALEEGAASRCAGAVRPAAMLPFLDAQTLIRPEVFVGKCASRFDEQTGALSRTRRRVVSSSSSLPRSPA